MQEMVVIIDGEKVNPMPVQISVNDQIFDQTVDFAFISARTPIQILTAGGRTDIQTGKIVEIKWITVAA